MNRVWIEIESPKDDNEGRLRAKLLCNMLKRLGVMYTQPVFWHEKNQHYCFQIDAAGGYKEAYDHGFWFDLDVLGMDLDEE